ncbi:MAG: UDP-3-O-(3-hydroxymyristoyl)glucosamine N-acyltransferase [Pyrinomonadaceae bacterium]
MKASEIAKLVGGKLRGSADPEIDSIADFDVGTEGSIVFADRPRSERTNASCVITSPEIDNLQFPTCIIVAKPKLAFAKAAAILHPVQPFEPSISNLAFVAMSANVDDAASIAPFVSISERSSIGRGSVIKSGARIGHDVTIGTNCVIHSNAVIQDRCTLGNNVIVHAGAVIGSDGFGYVSDEDGSHLKFPQIGTVVVEDDVEIGANSCIDRGALGETRIGEGTKIDNLVQIAHNVQIGKRCLIVSLSGISGSSILEDDVVLAGQVGIADHVTLKKGVIIGAKSAVFPNKIIPKGFWCGIPVQPIKDYKRRHAILKSVERLRKEVREIAKSVNDGR